MDAARSTRRSWTTLMSSREAHAKFLRKSQKTRMPMTALLDIAADIIDGMKPSELVDRAGAKSTKGGGK